MKFKKETFLFDVPGYFIGWIRTTYTHKNENSTDAVCRAIKNICIQCKIFTQWEVPKLPGVPKLPTFPLR